jgi:DNA-binding response OmpR family regulator
VRILVIENEVALASHITSTLVRCGHSLCAQHDGALGLRTALTQRPDLVVLDLESIRGRSLHRQVRRVRSASRVLWLTEKRDDEHRFIATPSGPADFLAKPFAMGELVTRVEGLGRLMPPAAASRWLQIADLRMDVRERLVTRAGKSLALSRREFALLHVLMCEAGRTFSRTELCERIWRSDHAYGSRTVEMSISRLRRKVDGGSDVPLVQTDRAVGYGLRQPAGSR